MTTPPPPWTLRHGSLEFTGPPHVVAILNVTPDSFSDGGLHLNADDALRRADRMIAQGAALIDVGPESTRPGAPPVSADDQIARIRTVIPAIRERHPRFPISIDTRNAAVASAAVEFGADIINDVSALSDPQMPALAAATRTPVILMHMRRTPESMQADLREDTYDDVVSDIVAFLSERIERATAAGLSSELVAVDPGLGFGKTVSHNLTILRRLDEFVALNHPVLVGASRKRFIGAVLDQPTPTDRLAGSLACAVAAALSGAHLIRAHDVQPTADALRLTTAIQNTR